MASIVRCGSVHTAQPPSLAGRRTRAHPDRRCRHRGRDRTDRQRESVREEGHRGRHDRADQALDRRRRRARDEVRLGLRLHAVGRDLHPDPRESAGRGGRRGQVDPGGPGLGEDPAGRLLDLRLELLRRDRAGGELAGTEGRRDPRRHRVLGHLPRVQAGRAEHGVLPAREHVVLRLLRRRRGPAVRELERRRLGDLERAEHRRALVADAEPERLRADAHLRVAGDPRRGSEGLHRDGGPGRGGESAAGRTRHRAVLPHRCGDHPRRAGRRERHRLPSVHRNPDALGRRRLPGDLGLAGQPAEHPAEGRIPEHADLADRDRHVGRHGGRGSLGGAAGPTCDSYL